MSLFAALVLSAAILPAPALADAAKTAPQARSGGDGGGVAASPPRSGGLPANVTAIGMVTAEILRIGTNAPLPVKDALDRRVREDSRGGTIEYQ